MPLTLQQADDDRKYRVVGGDGVVATLFLDEDMRIEHVCFQGVAYTTEARQVLAAVSKHARDYTVVCQSMSEVQQSFVSPRESLRVLRAALSSVPTDELHVDDLVAELSQIGVEIDEPGVMEVRAVLDRLLQDERFAGITYRVGGRSYDKKLCRILISAPEGTHFKGWHCVYPGLYIVPNYHPRRQGKQAAAAVNGGNNLVLGSEVISSVVLPIDRKDGLRRHTWSSATHPYYISAKQATVEVVTSRFRSRAEVAEQELRTLLLALLEKGDTYVDVIGWSYGPYMFAENFVQQRLVSVKTRDGRARGSESFCMWAYDVLGSEGKLDGAEIPSWFDEEGWRGMPRIKAQTPFS